VPVRHSAGSGPVDPQPGRRLVELVVLGGQPGLHVGTEALGVLRSAFLDQEVEVGFGGERDQPVEDAEDEWTVGLFLSGGWGCLCGEVF